MRICYRCLLWLHPPMFRRQFADEMLWIFDQSPAHGALFGDGAASLGRQWLLRSGWWKIALAIALAVFQITAGGLGLAMSIRRAVTPSVAATQAVAAYAGPLARRPIDLEIVMYLTVFVFSGLAAMVILLTFWMRRFTARRVR
jgi:hypothetical protein